MGPPLVVACGLFSRSNPRLFARARAQGWSSGRCSGDTLGPGRGQEFKKGLKAQLELFGI